MKKSLFNILLLCLMLPVSAEIITFSTDMMTGSIKQNGNSTILTGNARIKTESMEINADQIEIRGDDYRYIVATGNVKGNINNGKTEFSCGRMTYDRTSEIATLQNSVKMKDADNNVDAEAELIEYNQKTETAIMQINVNIKQEENTCMAAYAIYKKEAKTLDLSGNPNVRQGKDIFRAQQISLNLETKQITLDGRVRGSVTTTSEGSN